jgi:hypothetical protein
MTGDSNFSDYTFSWSLNGYDANYDPISTPLSCSSDTCEFSVPQTGWTTISVDVNKSNVGRDFSQEIYIQNVVVEPAPTFPELPGVPSIYNN